MSSQIQDNVDQNPDPEDEGTDDDFSSQTEEMDSELELDYEDNNWEFNQLLKWQVHRLIDLRKDTEKKSEKRRKQIIHLRRKSMRQRRKIHQLKTKLKALKKRLSE